MKVKIVIYVSFDNYIELLNKDLDNSIVNLIILANGINIENVWYNYIKHNINLSTNEIYIFVEK